MAEQLVRPADQGTRPKKLAATNPDGYLALNWGDGADYEKHNSGAANLPTYLC